MISILCLLLLSAFFSFPIFVISQKLFLDPNHSHFDFKFLLQPDFKSALCFTFLQSILSGFLSVLFGFILALYLFDSNKSRIVNLLGSVFSIPSIVAGFGVVLLFGRSGWLGQIFPHASVYGLTGVLVANLFFAIPFSTAVFLQSFSGLPLSVLRVKQILNLSDKVFLKSVLLPYCKQSCLLIFFQTVLITAQNFTLAIILGGGPSSSTIETLIYQNIFFSYDLQKALTFALFQSLIFGGVGFLVFKSLPLGSNLQNTQPKNFLMTPINRIFPILILTFLGLIVAAIFVEGISSLVSEFRSFPFADFLLALRYSFLFAFFGSFICHIVVYVAAFCGVLLQIYGHQKFSKGFLSLLFVLATSSPVVSSLGYLLWLQNKIPIWKLVAIPFVQAVGLFAFILPFHFVVIKQTVEQNFKLISIMNISIFDQIKSVYIPAFKHSLKQGFLLGIIMVVGQFTVTAILAKPQVETVTGLIYRLMGQYQHTHAAIAAMLFLLIVCIVVSTFKVTQNA